MTIFLHITDSSTRMLDKLKTFIRKNELFARRTILISHSPLAIYQVSINIICTLRQVRLHTKKEKVWQKPPPV